KVQPIPESVGTRLFEFASESAAFEAARLALGSGTEPVFVDVLTAGAQARLVVGFDGSRTRIEAHLTAIADAVAPARPLASRILAPDEDVRLRRALDDPEDLGLVFSNGGGDGGRNPPPLLCVIRLLALPTRLEEALARGRSAAIEQGGSVLGVARPGLGTA